MPRKVPGPFRTSDPCSQEGSVPSTAACVGSLCTKCALWVLDESLCAWQARYTSHVRMSRAQPACSWTTAIVRIHATALLRQHGLEMSRQGMPHATVSPLRQLCAVD